MLFTVYRKDVPDEGEKKLSIFKNPLLTNVTRKGDNSDLSVTTQRISQLKTSLKLDLFQILNRNIVEEIYVRSKSQTNSKIQLSLS